MRVSAPTRQGRIIPWEIVTYCTQKYEIKLQMSQTRAGVAGEVGKGLVNEQSDKAEKKDAMGEIHRLRSKALAVNLQMSQVKG